MGQEAYQRVGLGWPPADEIDRRQAGFQQRLAEADLDGALIYQNADLLYLTGTQMPAAAFLPAHGPSLVFGHPPLDRLVAETPGRPVEPMPRSTDLKDRLEDHLGRPLGRLGLELDVLPAAVYQRLADKALAGVQTADASALIRSARSIKTDFELGQIRAAARNLDRVISEVPRFLRPGMTELELEGEIVGRLRADGHQGVVSMRGFNQSIFLGHLLSGPSGLVRSKVASPTGGTGVGPGIFQGAGPRVIQEGDLVSIDLVGTHGGYLADQSRLFFTGPAPAEVRRAYEALLDLVEALTGEMRPGASCGHVYDRAFHLAEKRGIGAGFMGLEPPKCPFIGHGVGIELDEWPVLAKGSGAELASGNTVALEPRVFLPDWGVVGIEDTYLITENGPEPLTVTRRDLVEVIV
jgi:Xaa-Pro aminopeptidase